MFSFIDFFLYKNIKNKEMKSINKTDLNDSKNTAIFYSRC